MSTTVLENRQARHLYAIEDTFMAGIVLEGWEVKAILNGQANFNGGGAFIQLVSGEAWLEAMTITPLLTTNQGLLEHREPNRSRKLLLNRAELNKLTKRIIAGYTIVPLAVERERKIKILIGLAKGKKQHDKRETLKQRELSRTIARGVRNEGNEP